MKKAKIYMLDEKRGQISALDEDEYDSEIVLQKLLAQYPDLLPGDQIDPENPRRWMLVQRELGVPGDVMETGRWSLDHLFLDQDGIPTFVECKRSSDTRIRREVVAQMLDYAANGVDYWDVERLRRAAAESAENQGSFLADSLQELLGVDADEEQQEMFWKQVGANLNNHRVRLVFAADRLPKELRRMIEFLNEEMQHVEVLGVEIRQYRRGGDDSELAMVPRLVGMTEEARDTKRGVKPRRTRTTRAEFLSGCGNLTAPVFENLFDEAIINGHIISWGEVGCSIRYRMDGGKVKTFLWCYPDGTVQFHIADGGVLSRKKDFPLWQELLESGCFREGGDYSLTTDISTWETGRAQEIFTLMLDRMDGFLAEEGEGGS